VADQERERIAKLVYLDAFVPSNGQCVFDFRPPAERARTEERVKAEGDGWLIPPNPMPQDTAEADVAWAKPLRLPQPFKTFAQPIRLTQPAPHPARTYIYCKRNGPGDVFRQFGERAQREGWQYFEMDASHNPHITVPQELAALLDRIASGSTRA
jgi:hypothetical protein